jgi:hypothetical protein
MKDYNALQKDVGKLAIRRENIKRIQQILLNMLNQNRENVDQNDIYNLIEEMNLITDPKGMTGSAGFDHRNQSIGLVTPPTKENTLKAQSGIATVPNWYNKLKSNLKK